MSRTAEIPPADRVAESPSAPYTAVMDGERASSSVPWWKEAVRSWVPVLALAAVLVFQMVGLQRQIGDLRAEIGDLRSDVQSEIGGLRSDVQSEMGDLRDDVRSEMSDLRDDLRSEISELRVELGERITRLETLMEAQAERVPARPGG